MAVFSWTNEERSSNPITKFLEWKGAKTDGFFSYYDKANGSNETFDLTSPFIILKTGWSIKGYSQKEGGFWSNEVDNLGEEKIFVKNKDGVLVDGLWEDIKTKVAALGGKLQRVLTVLYDGQIIAFAVKGAALGAFIEYTQNNKGYMRHKLQVTGFENRKNGAIEFRVPVFAVGDAIQESEGKEAEKSAKLVDEFYNKDKRESENNYSEVDDSENEDLPFN